MLASLYYVDGNRIVSRELPRIQEIRILDNRIVLDCGPEPSLTVPRDRVLSLTLTHGLTYIKEG